MPKRFQGDDTHRLVVPAREAYRLWFSFLSMALDDPELQPLYNKTFYAPWGDIKAVKKFDDWWQHHWTLFAYESEARVIETEFDWKKARRDHGKVIIAVSRDQSLAETKRQVEAILKRQDAHKAARLRKGDAAAQFVISAPNLKYPSLRLLERIYRLWLKNGRNSELTAKAYFDWAVARNKKIMTHNKRIAEIRAEKSRMRSYAEDDQLAGRKASVEKIRWERAVPKRQVTETGWVSRSDEKYDQRRQVIWRYIRKARRIAKNAVAGSFPGSFTE